MTTFTAAYTKKYGGTAQQIDDSSAEAYAVGQLLEAVAAKTGKVDNATIISDAALGHLADAARRPRLVGRTARPPAGSTSCSGRSGKLLPVYPAAVAQAQPRGRPSPNWGG